jgi:hypothetical protein
MPNPSLRAMKSNPIHKQVVEGSGTYTRNGYIPHRRWAYTCPICGQTNLAGTRYGNKRSSRKMAKDALHLHVTKEH